MNLDLPESASILKNEARQFFATEWSPTRAKAKDDHDHDSPALWRRISELGWPGVIVPEVYGGSGDSFLALLVLMQEVGRAAAAIPFFSTAAVGALSLLEGGTEEQKSNILPGLCQGVTPTALALSEPEVDFGLDHLTTSASNTSNGYRISGTKVFVSNAESSSHLICVAKSVDHGGIQIFLIPQNDKTVSIRALMTTLDERDFEVTFLDTQASLGSLLGAGAPAHLWFERVLQKSAIAKCAEMLGAGRKVLEMTVDHAKTREQFGKPIGSLQAVQHHCANIATLIETAEMMTFRAGWKVDQNISFLTDALKAKAWTNHACRQAAALGHQVHGGIGFMHEYDLHLYTARMTSGALSFGRTPWCNDQIADHLFGPLTNSANRSLPRT